MKIKTVIGTTLLVVFSLFALGVFSQSSPAQTKANNSNTSPAMSGYMGQYGTMHGTMMHGWMMNGSMMGRTMMENQGATQKLLNRLASDLSAAKAQADSAAIKSKLADAGSVVARLKGEFSQYWGMMHNMPMHASYCYWTGTHQNKK